MEDYEKLETVLEIYAADSQMVLVDEASREPWIGHIVDFRAGVATCIVRPLRNPEIAMNRRKWKLDRIADVAAIEETHPHRHDDDVTAATDPLLDWAAVRREAARVASVAEEQIFLHGIGAPAHGTYIVGATQDGREVLYNVESQSIQTGKQVGSGSKPAGQPSVTDRAISGLRPGRGGRGAGADPLSTRFGDLISQSDAAVERAIATRRRGRSSSARNPGS